MLWVKAFHLICMVSWFAGLFYLPRLYVYHSLATDKISQERFKIMERKLYFFSTTPAAILTILLGIWLIALQPSYMKMAWLHVKLSLVFLLIIYHIYLGVVLKAFINDRNKHSHVFYRILNELPVVFLITIVILAVVKPLGVL